MRMRSNSHAISVLDLTSDMPAGTEPFQRGPTIANSPFSVPVVRLPIDVATLVHASSIATR